MFQQTTRTTGIRNTGKRKCDSSFPNEESGQFQKGVCAVCQRSEKKIIRDAT